MFDQREKRLSAPAPWTQRLLPVAFALLVTGPAMAQVSVQDLYAITGQLLQHTPHNPQILIVPDQYRAMGRAAVYGTPTQAVIYVSPQHMQADTPTLYLANHQSNADIWVLLSILPMHTKFVAKESLFKIPLLGGAMRAAGFIPINRESGTCSFLRRYARTASPWCSCS